MTLQVHVEGRGPDLALLHGWGMNAVVWSSFDPMLRARIERGVYTWPCTVTAGCSGGPCASATAPPPAIPHATMAAVIHRPPLYPSRRSVMSFTPQ